MSIHRPVLPEVVARQLATIRQEGQCNMLDRTCVQERAFAREFYELGCYIEDNPKEYSTLVFTGATVEETGESLRDVQPL